MAHDVFISYSNKDKPIADAICAQLEAAGIRCWIAPRDITAGEDWPTAITRAIAQGRVLVLVFSAHSNASEDVSRELFLAANNKLVIIPFKIENIEPEPGKQYYLARTHWLDALNPPTQEQIQNLVERVKILVPLKGPAVPIIRTQTVSAAGVAAPAVGMGKVATKQRVFSWLWLIPIGVVLLGLLGWGAFSLISKRLAVPIQPTQQQISTGTIVPTIALSETPVALLGATATTSTGTNTVSFSKVYISEAFDDNALEWPAGDSSGQDWLGTLTIANGVLDWQGTSVRRMNALIQPGKTSLQESLSDQEVAIRVNPSSQDMKGAYGLYFRAAEDGSSFYAFCVYDYAFALFKMIDGDQWKVLFGWENSPAAEEAGWLKMSVQATGSHFRLLVNDQLLTELDDESLTSGESGLFVTTFAADQKIQAQFDDFEVRLPPP